MRNPDSLCLGTVKLGIPDYGFSSDDEGRIKDPVFFLNQAEQRGIRRFDTSPRYGKSEEILGQYILQSKITPFVSSKIDNLNPGDPHAAEKMMSSVQSSLLRLHLSKLDICYLHQNELDIIGDSYIHDGLMLLKQRNLIRYSGVSLYSFEECEYALDSGIFDVIQVPVSIFDMTYYNRFIKGKKTSVHFVARSLLLQGILINRNMISSHIRQSSQILGYLNDLDQLAQRYSLSVLELGLAFTFSLADINSYLIGTTSILNLEKNIKCLDIALPPTAYEKALEMASKYKDWTNPRNWN
jgi:1-deoxyxylulose-5-phosphate synthase